MKRGVFLSLYYLLIPELKITDTKLDVQIYESATRFTEIGAGVGMWLRTFRYMSSADFLSEDFKNDLEKIADRTLTKDLRESISV